jgi:hypothetical protein
MTMSVISSDTEDRRFAEDGTVAFEFGRPALTHDLYTLELR